MSRLFPAAKDYATVYKKVDSTSATNIEKRLGSPLDPTEKEEFSFYPITGPKGQRLGTAIALAGKGDYGAIEVVIGVDQAGKIVGVYIQHSRERSTKALRSEVFLKQFVGKASADMTRTGRDIAAPAGAEKSAAVVALAVKKMLLFYDALMRQETKS